MTWAQGLTVAGLFVALCGAAVAAKSVIITQAQAKALASTYWDENTALKDSLLKQSRRAAWGLAAIATGTALQIFGQFV
jgi:hypothetical protein